MKVFCLKEGQGKTTELLQLAKNKNGYIVCQNPDSVFSFAKQHEITINFPLSYAEFLEGKYLVGGVKHIYIDDIDRLLNRISKCQIKAITITDIN